jgi:hypothetical protein
LTLSFSNGSLYLILFGVLFLLVILFMPQGIVPAVSKWWAGRGEKRARQSQAGTAVSTVSTKSTNPTVDPTPAGAKP